MSSFDHNGEQLIPMIHSFLLLQFKLQRCRSFRLHILSVVDPELASKPLFAIVESNFV